MKSPATRGPASFFQAGLTPAAYWLVRFESRSLRAQTPELRAVITGRSQAVALANQRLDLRSEDAYDVRFGPDMVDKFNELSP